MFKSLINKNVCHPLQAKMQNRKSKRQYVEIIGDKNGKYLMVTAAYLQGWEMEEYV